jgi:flagellar hook-basal body complex protein FliE
MLAATRRTLKGSNMIIQRIFEEIQKTRPIHSDEFSTLWLLKSPSYYRSLKSRGMQPSNQVLLNLMEQLRKQSTLMRDARHQVLLDVADKYERLADLCAKEIASRSVALEHSQWVRDRIIAAVNEINATRDEGYLPPIIIA